MNAITLHPTAATPIPVTIIATGRSGKTKTVRKPKDCTVADLRALLTAAGLKFTTKHTKAELRAILTSGQTFQAAAQERENIRRRAKRAEAKAAKAG